MDDVKENVNCRQTSAETETYDANSEPQTDSLPMIKAGRFKYFREAMVVIALVATLICAAVLSGVAIFHYHVAKGISYVAVLFGLAWIGAIAAQAQEAASPNLYRGKFWKHMRDAYAEAHSDGRLAGSVYGIIKWSVLAVAALMITVAGGWLTSLIWG